MDPADCIADTNCEVDDTASVDAAIDASEDSLIDAAFVDTVGDDVLNDFSLFGTYDNSGVPTDDASYTPCTAAGYSSTVEYGDGVDAGLDVPEPRTLTLFGASLAGIAFLRRRKHK